MFTVVLTEKQIFRGWEMAAWEAVSAGLEAVDHGGTPERGRT